MLYGLAHLFALSGFPRSIPINFAIVSSLYIAGSRYLVKAVYQNYLQNISAKENIIIYGAGEAGIQFLNALHNSRDLRPVVFIDDDVSLQGQIINGLPVYSLDEIGEVRSRYAVKRIILAIPAASAVRRKRILEMLRPMNLNVLTLPSLDELASGAFPIEHLREVDVNNLLGRDVVVPNAELLSHAITDKVILVTGAGGSIGSELCRQIYALSPKQLILYDNSEYALYTICKELSEFSHDDRPPDKHVLGVLGTVLDFAHMERILDSYNVHTIFHAAAYKHVPLVEQNVVEGVKNNLLGTKVVAEAAMQCGVERFVLVSSDKAVRPTSVMGATKRAAEQVIQCLALQGKTTFSIVRFGNVLGSSGSVVPLFRKQISEGGPVTLTHKEVTRYFMSIPEAAQLLIQAGTIANGGEVFVLDMKRPIKIYDLARNMIELSGHAVRDKNNPHGDISIIYVGLRPGEKLHEELFIDDKMEKTTHPRILRANEGHLEETLLWQHIDMIARSLDEHDEDNVIDFLKTIVKEYQPANNAKS